MLRLHSPNQRDRCAVPIRSAFDFFGPSPQLGPIAMTGPTAHHSNRWRLRIGAGPTFRRLLILRLEAVGVWIGLDSDSATEKAGEGTQV